MGFEAYRSQGHSEEQQREGAADGEGRLGAGGWPGRRTLTEKLTARSLDELASHGLGGGTSELPFGAQIRRSFGRYMPALTAHVGGPAAEACHQMGARAYALGDAVAFGSSPDLHTAAHETAHVVQQQAGVQLAGGAGEPGDTGERHADAVAARVVEGRSAEDLLASWPQGGAPTRGVQPTLADAHRFAKAKARTRKTLFTSFSTMIDYARGTFEFADNKALLEQYALPLAIDGTGIVEADDSEKAYDQALLDGAHVDTEADLRNYVLQVRPEYETIYRAYAACKPAPADSLDALKSQQILGGETVHSQPAQDGLRGSDGKALQDASRDLMEQLALDLRFETSGRSVGPSDHNMCLARVRVSGIRDGNLVQEERALIQDSTVNLFSSGDGFKNAPRLKPTTRSMTATGSAPASIGVDDKVSQHWKDHVGGRDTTVYKGDTAAVQAQFGEVTGAGLGRNKDSAAQTFDAQKHKHSEPVVMLAFRAQDGATAAWLTGLGFQSFIHFTLELHSERAMCWNCAQCLNTILSKPRDYWPGTWDVLWKGDLEWMPNAVVSSSVGFKNENRDVPAGLRGQAPISVADGTAGDRTMVGQTGWADESKRDGLLPPTIVYDPSGREAAEFDGALPEEDLTRIYGAAPAAQTAEPNPKKKKAPEPDSKGDQGKKGKRDKDGGKKKRARKGEPDNSNLNME